MTSQDPPLLEMREVSAGYGPGGSQLAVRAVTLAIRPGEIVGLVGESGAGKTTLGNCATGLTPVTRGDIWYRGALASTAGSRPAFPRVHGVQGVYQDPGSALNPRRTVGSLICEVLRVHRMVPRPAVAGRCSDLLAQVGLADGIKGRRPGELSGGMCQRVAIARALAFEPRLLVADEIVSALDASVQAQVINLLAELRERTGVTVLLITHDLAVVNQICDRVVVLHAGEVVESGPTTEVLCRPSHDYTALLIGAVPQLERGA